MNLIVIYIFSAVLVVNGANVTTTEETPPEPGTIRKACSKRGFVTQPPSRVNTTERIRRLRAVMSKENSVEDQPLDAYLITSGDEHQSEAVAPHDRRREYISGFSGSNGDVIVTFDKAALWTDGRYHLQADDQLNCDWLLMKQGHHDVPSQAEWLKMNLKRGGRVGADPRLISHTLWTSLKYELENSSIQLVEVRKNLVDLIWVENRPPPSNKHVYVWELKYAGVPWMEKVKEVREEMMDIGVDAFVITALDEIAWLLNIRGRDIPYNPFVKSYVILTTQEIHMFVNKSKITDSVKQHLRTEFGVNPYAVILHDYEDFWQQLPTLGQIWKYVLLPSAWVYSEGVSQAIFNSFPEEKRLSKPSPIIFFKAQKNKVEIAGMEQANIRDSAALIDFLSYLEKDVERGEYWDEVKVSRVVNEYRYETELGRGNSFETIAAYGANGAKPHYETSNTTNVQLNNTSTLVLDSGGQYLDGTTDVTRTLHFGAPTDEQRFVYTRVLMGCIELSSLIFPANLRISAADVVARAPLWQVGLDYMHGTGHGVGAFLSVHESPISVSFSGPQKQQEFKVGYFFSNEPGYYKEGDFGVRLENILEVVIKHPRKPHIFGYHYLGFKDVTLVPYEPKLIDFNLLSPRQRKWLNNYNIRIRSYVGAELKRQKKMDAFYWMMEKTRHIPEHGEYSSAQKHLHYHSLFYFSVILCFINKIFYNLF